MGCIFKQGCQGSLNEQRLNEGDTRIKQDEVCLNSVSGKGTSTVPVTKARAGPWLVYSKNRKEANMPGGGTMGAREEESRFRDNSSHITGDSARHYAEELLL